VTDPIRILVVDDSAVVRGLLSKLISSEPDLEFVGSAPDGKVAIARTAELSPDIVVLDIDMPVMGGLDALRVLRRNHPDIPVIMFSTMTLNGASITVEALSAGAADYATKPTGTGTSFSAADQVRTDLLTKIRAIVGTKSSPRSTSATTTAPGPAARPAPPAQPAMPAAPAAPGPAAPASIPTARPTRRRGPGQADAVLIGSSTGGPAALESVLPLFPAGMPVPIFLVQHMPPTFTGVLADRLDKLAAFPVAEASEGTLVEPGHCYLAAGGKHMRLSKEDDGIRLRLDEGPKIKSCRPSVDALFDSAAEVYGGRLVAGMLTGMGDDGLDSCRRLSHLGVDIIAQDEATSVVWGMPGAITKAGLVTACLPLHEVTPALITAMGRPSIQANALASGRTT
jgi:two-component system chemotaxis response regulator CheB